MWKGFIPQDSHEGLNFKWKYNGKSSKCLREITYNRYFYMSDKACKNFSEGSIFLYYIWKRKRKNYSLFPLVAEIWNNLKHFQLHTALFRSFVINDCHSLNCKFIFFEKKKFFRDFGRMAILYLKYFSSQ